MPTVSSPGKFLFISGCRGSVDDDTLHIGILQRQNCSREIVIEADILAPDQFLGKLRVGGAGLRREFLATGLEILKRHIGIVDLQQDGLTDHDIGLGKVHGFFALWRDRDAGYHQIEFALLKRRKDTIPGGIHEFRYTIDPLTDGIHHVHVKAHDLTGCLINGFHRRVGRVGPDIQNAPLQIRSERRGGGHCGEGSGGNQVFKHLRLLLCWFVW